MRRSILLPLFALVAIPLGAQQQPSAPVSPEAAALRTCAAYGERRMADSARIAGTVAEAIYRKRVSANANDVDAIVGLARTLSQCLVPSASFLTQGELSSEAMDLLDRAIELHPDNWMARFILGSIAYRSPAFLGRGKRAVREFEYLIQLNGDRTDNPMQARVYEMRGMQLSRAGQTDSARTVWMRGAKLFPRDVALQAIVARYDNSTAPAPARGDSAESVPVPAVSGSPAIGASVNPDTGVGIPTDSVVTPAKSSLKTVRVTARASAPSGTLPSVREVPRSQVLMTAGGAADVLQAVQALPGATRVGEGSDIYTRGGDAAETPVVLNGGRMLSLSRFEGLSGGLFGALEPFVVKSVRYSSGGFSARYGNALSGVIDIETDGRPRERHSRAGLSLVQASATTRAPFTKSVGGWVSGRVSNTGALLATHGRGAEYEGAPHSEEMIASVIANPSVTSELRATALVERDASSRIITAAGWRGAFQSTNGTQAAILSSRWLSSSAPVLLRATVAGSNRSTDWRFGVLSRQRNEGSFVSRLDLDWQAASALMIRSGVEHGAFSRREAGALPTTPSVATGAPTRSLAGRTATAAEVGGYAESELTRGDAVLTLGVRSDRLPGEDKVSVDPRAALSYKSGVWMTRLSAGVFHQGRWRPEATIPNGGLPSGVSTEARHLVAGVERTGITSTLRIEAFAKQYSKYQTAGSGPAVRSGSARGLDLLAQRSDVGRISGWVGYSLLDATLLLTDGSRVRSPFDVTHTSTGSVTARINNDWSAGYSVRYGSGTPLTPIVGSTQNADGVTVPVYGATMSDRLPEYFRMDARLMRFFRMPQYLLTTFVEVINVGDRPNVSSMTYDASYQRRTPMHTFFATRTVVVGGEVQFR